MLDIVNDLVDTELTLPSSFLSIVERWSRSYLRTQIPIPVENNEQKYQFNILSI